MCWDDTEVQGREGMLDIAFPSTVIFCCAGTCYFFFFLSVMSLNSTFSNI